MRLIAPTRVSEELLEQAEEVLAGIAPGTVGSIELDGEDELLVRRALASLSPTARVYRARRDSAQVLRVRVYTDEELAERAARPPTKRKPRAKSAPKPAPK